MAEQAGIVDLGDLGFDEGAHLLVKRALATAPRVSVRGTSATLAIDLPAWCRSQGHACEGFNVSRGNFDRTRGAERAGGIDDVVDHAPARWGLAARGALVEAGAPELDLPLANKSEIWADEAARLYAQAAAAQWDPETAIPWNATIDHPADIEDAIVQVMTYLIENETAALLVPARFLGRIHPHFREVMQLLAIQSADEARHIEVFTRRARLRRSELGLSTAGGQASLATLFDALVLLAAGGWAPEQLRKGHAAVVELTLEMDRGRTQRLIRLGYDAATAAELSSLHTRNFM